MRSIWVKVDPWDKDMVTTAIEGGADAVMVPPGYSETVKALAKIETVAEDAGANGNRERRGRIGDSPVQQGPAGDFGV